MSVESFPLASFPEVMRLYHNDGAVFVTPFDGRRYCITSVDDTGCMVKRLDGKQSERIQFGGFEEVFNTVRAKGGTIDYNDLFDESVPVIKRTTYLQAPQLGLSHDKKVVTDLSSPAKAFEHFGLLLQNLRVDRSSGDPKLFKPAIVACVIDGIDAGELTENKISFDWILPKFLEKTREIGASANPEKASYPFYHLTRDLFWILCYKDTSDLFSGSPSPKQLREKVRFAILKETYWQVLSNEENRQRFLRVLAESWWPAKNHISLVSQNNGWATKIADFLKNEMPSARLQARLKFESKAKELIENKLGQLSDSEVRELFQVINTEEKPRGGITKNRFAMAFIGNNVNLVTSQLDRFNQWVKRLWTESEDQLKETLDEFWRTPLPGMPSLPPLILYLRDPDKFSIWMEATTKGLKKITGFSPGPNRDGDAYFNFNSEVNRLREKYTLQPQVMDALLSYFGRDLPQKLDLQGLEPEPEPEPLLPVNRVVELEDISNQSNIQVEILARWVRAIERKGQAVIYGPPGTGKTFIAEHLANHLIGGGNGFSEFVQFHPAYAYEDFIQGIRPSTTGNGTLCYSLTPGRFLDFCTRAKERSGKCVLIIDEINRANLARVFGELMYLLEYRNSEIPLAGGEYLSIPENVRLIGTMNTADRSIALVDHALRRRFAFIALRPQYETLIKSHADSGFPIGQLVSILKRLNGVIGDPNYEVGISFFIRKDLADHIEDIWCMEVEPYIEEYFFDQPGKVDEFRWSNIGQELLS